MKRQCWLILVVFALAVILIPMNAFADDPKARDIMQKVEDRDDGDNQTANMLMTLTDKNNDIRKKYFKNFRKDYGKDTKTIMFIERPANIKNTGFLTFDYDDAMMTSGCFFQPSGKQKGSHPVIRAAASWDRT